MACLLYTSDAADERSSVNLGGRSIINKKKKTKNTSSRVDQRKQQRYTLYRQDKHLTKQNKKQRD